MAADIFTKHFTSKDAWHHACALINHVVTQQSPAVLAYSASERSGSETTTLIPACPSNGGPTNAKLSPIRRLVKFCCGPDSLLSQSTAASAQCECIRITIEDDVTTESGKQHSLNAVTTKTPTLLWASMPCTGGSPWQFINAKRPGGPVNLRKHLRLYHKLW